MENGFFNTSFTYFTPPAERSQVSSARRGSAADHPDSFDLALAIHARLPRHPDGPRGAQPAERGAWRGACRADAPPCRGRQHDRGAAGPPAWPKVHPCRKCTLAWALVPPQGVRLAAVGCSALPQSDRAHRASRCLGCSSNRPESHRSHPPPVTLQTVRGALIGGAAVRAVGKKVLSLFIEK